jgi:hypothetical protein
MQKQKENMKLIGVHVYNAGVHILNTIIAIRNTSWLGCRSGTQKLSLEKYFRLHQQREIKKLKVHISKKKRTLESNTSTENNVTYGNCMFLCVECYWFSIHLVSKSCEKREESSG